MNKKKMIKVLATAGTYLHQHASKSRSDHPELAQLNNTLYNQFESAISAEKNYNGWFTWQNIRLAMEGISFVLEQTKLDRWLDSYDGIPVDQPKSIGVVMAGNIPFVVFHDMISVLVSGHTLLAKASSKDERLMKLFGRLLTEIEPSLQERIRFTDEYLNNADAIIATGSNNTARHFEYYFREKPHIIRRNRNGIAVLHGNESDEELMNLGKDIFTFFGLGCRNVTKLYIPENYQIEHLLHVLESYSDVPENNKYGNNIDYHRTLYLMNQEHFYDNGIVLFKENKQISSPVGVVYYEKYAELETLKAELTSLGDQVQCIVDPSGAIPGSIQPGKTQFPELWDYADGVDTLNFLKELGR